MKSTFETTLIKNEMDYQFASLSFNPSIINPLSPICIPRLSQDFIVSNHGFFLISYENNYNIITFYIKEIFLKCI